MSFVTGLPAPTNHATPQTQKLQVSFGDGSTKPIGTRGKDSTMPLPIVRSEVSETHFGFYSDDDIKALSVKKIVSSVARDTLGHALVGGLYDPALGPIEQPSQCQTCGQGYATCPGHCGHVELDVPVYNPLMFPSMYLLLRAKCLFCHKFRLGQAKVRHFLVKLKLLELENLTEFSQFDDFLLHTDVLDIDATQFASDLETRLKTFELQYDALAAARVKARTAQQQGTGSGLNKSLSAMDVNQTKTLRREIIDIFHKTIVGTKKCENCGCISKPFRKDGYTKIYMKPLPKRSRVAMRGKNPKSACDILQREKTKALRAIDGSSEDEEEEDVDNDSDANDSDEPEEDEEEDEDEEDAAMVALANRRMSPMARSAARAAQEKAQESDKYLLPQETQGQLELLWRQVCYPHILPHISLPPTSYPT